VTVLDLLASQDRLAGIIFFDTTVSVPDLLPHVQAIREQYEVPLEVYRAPIPYEEVVSRYGFPGPAQHGLIMSYLKGRGVRAFRKRPPGEVLASGVRTGESKRRLINAASWSRFEGVWCHAPILDWSTEKVWSYVAAHRLPLSPAYKTLHLSGDCLCGAFADPAEMPLIRTFYPELAERLCLLEERLAGEGKVRNIRARRWGGGTGGLGFTRKQSGLESFMCGSCAGP